MKRYESFQVDIDRWITLVNNNNISLVYIPPGLVKLVFYNMYIKMPHYHIRVDCAKYNSRFFHQQDFNLQTQTCA